MKSLTLTLFAVLAITGCGKKPLDLSTSEKLDAFTAWGKLQKKANSLQTQFNESLQKIEALDAVKKERAAQAEQSKLMEPMQKAIGESNARLEAIPEVKTQKAVQDKLRGEVAPEQKLWNSLQDGLRRERGLPVECGLDTVTFDQWSKQGPDGKQVPCQAPK